MNVTKICIGRLYNLGSYEHIRYEVTVDVKEGESAAITMIGLERLMEALAPESKWAVKSEIDLKHEARRVDKIEEDATKLDANEFARAYGYHIVGTPDEYAQRCRVSLVQATERRNRMMARAEQARKLLDDLGGAAVWKDHKLDWECQDGDDYP